MLLDRNVRLLHVVSFIFSFLFIGFICFMGGRAVFTYMNALEAQRFIGLFREIYKISLSEKCVPVEIIKSIETHDLFDDSFGNRVHIESMTSTGFVVFYKQDDNRFVLITCDICSESFKVQNTIPRP